MGSLTAISDAPGAAGARTAGTVRKDTAQNKPRAKVGHAARDNRSRGR